MPFVMSVDLGQSKDYTAVSILEHRLVKVLGLKKPERRYMLLYLERIPLGTPYPVIVATVLDLLSKRPLSPTVPLVVDKTGVGVAVVDMFRAGVPGHPGVRPRAITIHGGDAVTAVSKFDIRVPKRELAGLLISLYENKRLQAPRTLALMPTLAKELLNFKPKVNIATGNDSYEAWRESIHDDLVLSVAMGCWYAENMSGRTFSTASAGGRETIVRYAASGAIQASKAERRAAGPYQRPYTGGTVLMGRGTTGR